MSNISTRNLDPLPDIDQLKALMQSLAMLDAILCDTPWLRTYSFNAHWSENEAIGKKDNGAGDDIFVLFTPDGAILKGFDHEAPMSPWSFNPIRMWPGVLDQVPTTFQSFLQEPAFGVEEFTTFCIWRFYDDSAWQRGDITFPPDDDPDGSRWLLSMFDGNPHTYQDWAKDYYERPISLEAVEHIYQHKPLTEEIVKLLNSETSLADVEADRAEIGYPK